MRNRFNDELIRLNDMLSRMCNLVQEAIANTVLALSTNNLELAQQVMDNDDVINRAEKGIESLCLHLLLTEQPVAGDLRTVSSALKVITDLERIGDQATDISRLVVKNNKKQLTLDYGHISEMATATIDMVKDAIVAFANRNIELAQFVYDCDDKVDRLFTKCRSDVVKLIVHDPANSDEALDMIMIAKYFERIGDHATNIAEWVAYAITGNRSLSRQDM